MSAIPKRVLDPPDETLMLRYQQGDRSAFAILVRRHQTPLFNFALRQMRAPQVAEEIVQETFVRVVANIPSMPSYAEGVLLDRLEAKLRQDFGAPVRRSRPEEERPSEDAGVPDAGPPDAGRSGGAQVIDPWTR